MTDQAKEIGRWGLDLIRDPLLNKGAAFTTEERRLFSLEGLLPQRAVSIDIQRQRILANLDRLHDPLDKYVALASLQDRNEHLFFNVLISRLEELLPVVYTPTVGLATQRFSHVFQRGRGVWITPDLQGRIAEVLANAAGGRRIRLIVATDNESILGIGDQGAGGMAISIGKLSLYTAAAGIDPATVLPVSLDVGTDNQALRADPLYLGWPHPRLRGSAYTTLLDEFVAGVGQVFPGALLQWEDFRKDNALRVLERYRGRLPSFNDDIQGTGAVALAGLLCAGRITGRPLASERVVILGAGAAGLGIARQIRAGMAAAGLPHTALREAIAVLDSKGLVVDAGGHGDLYKQELAFPATTAEAMGLIAGNRGLAQVVEKLRPTVLIGASGQAGAFTQQVVQSMARAVERPVILPLSNPTAHCEAVPEDLYRWTDGRALVATGSPFADVVLGGRRIRVGQGNNAFIFPGIGLAALATGATEVADVVFQHAAKALADAVTPGEREAGLLYPPVSRLRETCRSVARAVVAESRPGLPGDALQALLAAQTWEPIYARYVPASVEV
jgi:malic enzyme